MPPKDFKEYAEAFININGIKISMSLTDNGFKLNYKYIITYQTTIHDGKQYTLAKNVEELLDLTEKLIKSYSIISVSKVTKKGKVKIIKEYEDVV